MLSVDAESDGVVAYRRRCVLLSGVFDTRAGALSQILVHLGVDQANQSSDFEQNLKSLNQAILESAGFDECSIEPLDAGWYGSSRYAEFRDRAIALVQSAFAASSLFALKGAVIGPLVPFWHSVLEACDVEPVILNFYDDPATFAYGLDQSCGVGFEAGRAIWLARVVESERASRGLVRVHLTHDALLEDWEGALARVTKALGITRPAWSPPIRSAIVSGLAGSAKNTAKPAARKIPQAGLLGQWRKEMQGIVWRWAREGEDDRCHARIDELGQLSDKAREFVAIALAAIAEVGGEVQRQKQEADALLARVAELQQESAVMQATTQAQTAQLAELRETLANIETERDRLAAMPDSPVDGLAKIEAKWAKIFQSSREHAEILVEQNGVFQAAIQRLTAQVDELEESLAQAKADSDRLRLIQITEKAEVSAVRAEFAEYRKVQDASRKSLEKERERTAKSLAEARARIAKLRAEAGSRETTIERLHNQLLANRAGAVTMPGTPDASAKINLSLKRLLQHLKPSARKKMLRHKRLRQMIASSGLFDREFYASRYPDVVAAGGDLLDHFIMYGGAEGRHPSLSFNSRWYLNEYPDTRSAGLNPLVHYLEHGRDEGRRRRSLVDAGTATSALADASAAPTAQQQAAEKRVSPPPEVKAESSELESMWRPRTGGWKAMLSADFGRQSAVVSLDELSRRTDARPVAIGQVIVASFAADTPQSAIDRLALFAALGLNSTAAVTISGEHASQPAPHALLSNPGCGFDLLADGWWDGEFVLNLRASEGFAGLARVFQIDSANHLQCVAEVTLGGGETDLIEVAPVDPLGALLIIFARRDGSLLNCAVVPFPSLLRGGVHYGELATLETVPGTMATLAQYTQMLALEWLGWPEGPGGFGLARIEVDMRGASGTEPIFRQALMQSITQKFGIMLRAREGSFTAQRQQLVSMFEALETADTIASRQDARGMLVIPSDCVPSIYAMVARRFAHDHALSRFAVVDAATIRPRADVSLPFDEGLAGLQHADMPAHAPFVVGAEAGDAGRGGPVFPLAVRHYSEMIWRADPLMPVSPDQDMVQKLLSGDGAAVTVVIDVAHDDAMLASCLSALENQVDVSDLDIVLTGWPEGEPVPSCRWPVRAMDGRNLTPAGRLNAAAMTSQAQWLMILAPCVLLPDPRTIAMLAHIGDRPQTASAACALVTEFQDDALVSVHSAGYFPTRASLHGEPVFDFDQVDVSRVLPAATYPVVANHAKCVLYKTEVFHQLGGFDAQRFPVAMHDLDFGFRALAAGHANLCTTLVRAAVEQANPSADFADPLAHRAVRPADWQSLLDRVTTIKEMRR